MTLEKLIGKMEKDGNLDDVSLHIRGIFSDGDGSVVWKELGDSKEMQTLETEYGKECVTSLREIARELIPMATNLPIHWNSSRIQYRIGSVATKWLEGKQWNDLEAEFA